MTIVDPNDVDSRDSFVAFVAALRESIEAVLKEPLPDGRVETRGGWTNWTLASFISAMSAWLKSSGRLPLDRGVNPSGPS